MRGATSFVRFSPVSIAPGFVLRRDGGARVGVTETLEVRTLLTTPLNPNPAIFTQSDYFFDADAYDPVGTVLGSLGISANHTSYSIMGMDGNFSVSGTDPTVVSVAAPLDGFADGTIVSFPVTLNDWYYMVDDSAMVHVEITNSGPPPVEFLSHDGVTTPEPSIDIFYFDYPQLGMLSVHSPTLQHWFGSSTEYTHVIDDTYNLIDPGNPFSVNEMGMVEADNPESLVPGTTYIFQAAVTDANGSDNAAVHVNVAAATPNNPPEFDGTEAEDPNNPGQTVDTFTFDVSLSSLQTNPLIGTLPAEDLDGDTLTFTGGNGDFTITTSTGNTGTSQTGDLRFTGTTLPEPGTYTLQATVDDGRGGDDDAQVAINIITRPPEFLMPGETDATVQTDDVFTFYVTANQLSNGGFAGTLRAEDPDGDPITWSLSGTTNGFSVNPQTGQLAYAGTATAGMSFDFSAKVESTVESEEPDNAQVRVHVIGLHSLDFIENGRIRPDNGTFADESGQPYPDREWTPDLAVPFTHQMGKSLKVVVRLVGLPASTPYNLTGDAAGADLDFSVTGTTSSGNALTATDPLPNQIGRVDKPISWSLEIDGQQLDLGITQNLIHLTFGNPIGILTESRINWLTETADMLSDRHEIVEALHSGSLGLGDFKLGNNPDSIWEFMDGALAECIDHVKVIDASAKLLGLPAGTIGYVYARTNGNIKGVFSTVLNGAFESEPGTNRVLMYRDGNGGLNKWEAVYVLTDNGVTKYYAGFSSVYMTPKEVMEGVADKLVWVDPVTGGFSDDFNSW